MNALHLSSRLDPGSAGPHDPVPALLLLLPHCIRVSAVQTGQGRTLLLHRHLPDLGKWVWLHRTPTGHTLSRCGWSSEVVCVCSQIPLTSLLVSPRCVCDVRGHHLHRDESGRWHRRSIRLRLCAGLGGFPSVSHQRAHLYRPEEERMRERRGEEKRGGGVSWPLTTTSHCASCPQTIDWHPNNTIQVSPIIFNT